MRRPALWLVLLAGCAHTPVESAVPSWTLLSATPDVNQDCFQMGVEAMEEKTRLDVARQRRASA